MFSSRIVSSPRILQLAALFAVMLCASSVNCFAALTSYVSNPHSNSTDWANAVTAAGSTVNTINFDDISTGQLTLVTTGNYALNSYQASKGVSFAVKGNAPAITYGVGPGDSGSYQLNSGEGAHPASNYLSFPPYPGYSGGYATGITVNFNDAVSAVGFFTIGLNNSFTPGINRITITAYSGPNATGSVLGSAVSPDALNFNPNNLYFMGLVNNTDMIKSLQISGSWQQAFGDKLGFDNFTYARTPEPATVCLLALGSMLFYRRSA